MTEKETAYKPEPTPLPAPGPEHTAEGLAEKLYEAWASYWKSGDKVPAWKDADLSIKLRWRAHQIPKGIRHHGARLQNRQGGVAL